MRASAMSLPLSAGRSTVIHFPLPTVVRPPIITLTISFLLIRLSNNGSISFGGEDQTRSCIIRRTSSMMKSAGAPTSDRPPSSSTIVFLPVMQAASKRSASLSTRSPSNPVVDVKTAEVL
ncbi:unnamed protein product [Rotaria sp. Silwood2]|nr:unnamed protein product [Rotaria sp. Silwood2]CAF3135348.1 unnamed protein product [Rotaria sp. Silwood2]CAF3379058.1 unnamed protein product [Rotaria sp. Silwood2]CAF4446145.1 unnamed protein product [Rotaria sp. Silwood2]CAF4459599.1 unnamed protein product [Rotaria sp. Silwood2]